MTSTVVYEVVWIQIMLVSLITLDCVLENIVESNLNLFKQIFTGKHGFP